jgi:alginate O-acetyltransferase complex protein AlgI
VGLFALGLSKKILIANPLAQAADVAFAAGGLHWYDAWYGIMCYAFQIYFDFSGYSDMAVGLALMMGFVLMQNFNSPYKADSITEFWHRWHISLSTWLRDYLYIPLGGNRNGRGRTYINLMVVMLIGGLWHGASWNFVIWGAIHGGMLALERLQGKNSAYRRLPRALRVGLTFGIVCITWAFFRADTLAGAVTFVGGMFGLHETAPSSEVVAAVLYSPYHLLVFVVAVVLVWGCPNSWECADRITAGRAVWIAVLLILSVAFMWTQTENPFIYFQF